MNENAAVEGDSPGLRDIGEVWVVPDPEDQNQIQPLDSGAQLQAYRGKHDSPIIRLSNRHRTV